MFKWFTVEKIKKLYTDFKKYSDDAGHRECTITEENEYLYKITLIDGKAFSVHIKKRWMDIYDPEGGGPFEYSTYDYTIFVTEINGPYSKIKGCANYEIIIPQAETSAKEDDAVTLVAIKIFDEYFNYETVKSKVKLNLDKYYEGFGDSQINDLIKLFINAKLYVDQANKSFYKEDSSASYMLSDREAIKSFSEIDQFMIKNGKDPIFEIKEAMKKLNTYIIQGEDARPFMEKYCWLMSEAE